MNRQIQDDALYNDKEEGKNSEGKYRIIEVEDTFINQTTYIAQKKNWLGIWRDISYGKFFIESAEDDIRRDKGEFKIVKYM